MSKFCGNCGARMDDDARVCGMCGTVFDGVPPVGGAGSVRPKKKGKGKFAAVGLGGVTVIVAAVVIIVSSVSGSGYEKVIDAFMSSASSAESPDIAKLIEYVPEEFFTYVINSEGMTRIEAVSRIQNEFDSLYDTWNTQNDSWSVEYEIVDEDDYSASQVRVLSNDCEDRYDFTVTAGKELELKLEISMTRDGETTEQTVDVPVTLIQVDGKWCLWEVYGSSLEDMAEYAGYSLW